MKLVLGSRIGVDGGDVRSNLLLIISHGEEVALLSELMFWKGFFLKIAEGGLVLMKAQ